MSTAQQKGNGKDGPVRVDFAFRRELAEKVEGNLASFCYQCGACAGDCPATTYGHGFNPREIMLKVLYGLEQELIREDSIVWHCTNCYNCHERCPQEVKPVEVIISIKNMLADRGILPETVRKVTGTFEETGRTVPFSPAIDKMRARFGLAPMAPVPIEEIRELIHPEEKAGTKQELSDAAGRAAVDPSREESAALPARPRDGRAAGGDRAADQAGGDTSDPSEQVTRPLPIIRPARRR